jgi:hypothetical protein
MVLAASQTSSVTLSCRAGKSLPLDILIYDENTANNSEMHLESYQGRLQVRDLRGRRRVLINAIECDDRAVTVEHPTAPHDPAVEPHRPLRRTGNGHWLMFLGKSYTSWLPYACQIEIDLTNLTDPEDVIPLVSGTLNIIPEGVTD